MQAVKQAFANDFSVVQGPPGTGKTQTILNIIANCLVQNKTIAVVSGNNEATRNVLEKLEAQNLSFVAAFLGNKENIKRFFDNLTSVPNITKEWSQLANIDQSQQKTINERLQKILFSQLEIPKLKMQIQDFVVEKRNSDARFSVDIATIPKKARKKIQKNNFNSRIVLQKAAQLDMLASKTKRNLFEKIKYRWIYGIKSKNLTSTMSSMVDYLHNLYYQIKLDELCTTLNQKELECIQNNIEQLKTNQKTNSQNILYKYLANRYQKTQNSNEISLHNYKDKFINFAKRYPIVLSTTNALCACSGEGFLYDYLIIDEASQVNILTACIALACAKNVVIVGDKMQLPHIVKTADIQPLQQIFSLYDLPKQFEYTKYSILDGITDMYGSTLPNVLLNEHYRCDPQIIGFCNKRFYDNSLIVQTMHNSEECGIKMITNEPHHYSGRTNIRQLEIIDKDILPKIEKMGKYTVGSNHHKTIHNSTQIGLVAPYRNQVELLKERFDKYHFLIDTVHKFQGKEKNIVIMSTVADRLLETIDGDKVDFLNNANLMNVAISRAKDILYIIASTTLVKQQGLLCDLAKYNAYYCNKMPEHTTVYSIFDLMFDEYAEHLQSLKDRLIKISQFDSENIIGTIIQDICKSKKYGLLKYHHNYPLSLVINYNHLGNAEDIKFVKNLNTHCDFIIFDLLNKVPYLVIEVDGRQHNKAIQKVRDQRKDRLLASVGIQILRLPTTAIDCTQKIEQALHEAIKTKIKI